MGRYGENIHKRKDGRWEARLLVKDPVSGIGKYRYYYGKTYDEAKQKKEQAIRAFHHMDQNKADPIEDCSFRDLANQWMIYKKDSVKASTYALYSYYLKQYLFPFLGDKMLSEFRADEISITLVSIQQQFNLSVKTMSDIRSVLRMIVKEAQLRGKMLDISLEHKLYKYQMRRVEIFTPSEYDQLDQYLHSNVSNLSLGILLSLYCGLRIGEICALTWDDFNFRDGFFRITKTLERIYTGNASNGPKTKIVIQSAKTASSDRIIPISKALQCYLDQFSHKETCYILTGSTRFMEPRTLTRKYKALLSDAGIPAHTYHSLRHYVECF